ncbi:hypothetical protein [Sinorhizobium fredii]|uniref:hypothetical protein n=1 Tax=Rhizobium fredii TaxID=380 RepID=UPI0004BC40DA|nr:hypothetical protein [Sinorhizobium fredii]
MDLDHTCPFCNRRLDAATAIEGDLPPRNGDFSLCIKCGEWSIFDARREGGLRPPNHREYVELLKDDVAITMREIWLNVMADEEP